MYCITVGRMVLFVKIPRYIPDVLTRDGPSRKDLGGISSGDKRTKREFGHLEFFQMWRHPFLLHSQGLKISF